LVVTLVFTKINKTSKGTFLLILVRYCAAPVITRIDHRIPIGLDKQSLWVVYSHSGIASDIKTEVSW